MIDIGFPVLICGANALTADPQESVFGHAAIGYKIMDGKIYCHPGWENYSTLYSFEDNYQ